VTDPAAPFDQIFADLVLPDPQGVAPPSAAAPLAPADEGRIQEALRLFTEGLYARSADVLEATEDLAARDPRAAALAAAHRSFATGRLQPAIQRCLALLETRQHLPDIYAVLGVLLLKSKQRAQAYEAFRQGLRLSPAHPALQSRLEAMGVRHPPPLPFLPRCHRVNRLLGRLRAWLGGPRWARSVQ